MADKKEEREDRVTELVRQWVEKNSAEFTDSGKPDGKPLYRERVFGRCEKYRDAPDEYLEAMLKTLPETIKWYFNVFQTILVAGILGVTTTLFILFLNGLSTWVQKLSVDFSIVNWALPLTLFLIIVCRALKTNEVTQSSWLSNFIQTKSYIRYNLKEIHIEIYYIAEILRIRKAKREDAER